MLANWLKFSVHTFIIFMSTAYSWMQNFFLFGREEQGDLSQLQATKAPTMGMPKKSNDVHIVLMDS